jgi:hypothetical protein
MADVLPTASWGRVDGTIVTTALPFEIVAPDGLDSRTLK